MSWLPDDAVERLRGAVDLPDLPGSRYRVEGRLGAGGMGTVYRARDHQLERPVAIKVATRSDDDGRLRMRMEREARVIARLEHPGVVPIHEIGTLGDGRVFYVMKLVEGQTLEERFEMPSSTSERLRLFVRLCEVVAYAHDRGVIHRDLKPTNVMVGRFGELFVMDWGLARVSGESEPAFEGDAGSITGHATLDGTVLGTPGFMAPEQERGEAVDHRADIFALGEILRLTVPDAPRRLGAIIERAAAEAPGDRYQDASALADDVTRYLDRKPVSAYQENALERIGRFVDANRFVVYLVVAYAVLRVFVLFLTRG